jgi:hypothetical protein
MPTADPETPTPGAEAHPIAPVRTGAARIFVSFDQEHDGDLHDRLLAEAADAESGFEIAGRSGALSMEDPWQDRQRQRIREADLLVVICGEHTDRCRGVAAELRMAQEEGTPYFLIWGRREIMCKLPEPVQKDDGMYSWTPDILRDRIRVTLRDAREETAHAASFAARAAQKAARAAEGS